MPPTATYLRRPISPSSGNGSRILSAAVGRADWCGVRQSTPRCAWISTAASTVMAPWNAGSRSTSMRVRVHQRRGAQARCVADRGGRRAGRAADEHHTDPPLSNSLPDAWDSPSRLDSVVYRGRALGSHRRTRRAHVRSVARELGAASPRDVSGDDLLGYPGASQPLDRAPPGPAVQPVLVLPLVCDIGGCD